MNEVLNISGYRFVAIADPQALRETLLDRARSLQLLGTVLIATEGINLFLAGPEDGIGEFLRQLRTDPRFAGLQVKESWSAHQPFAKLLVKVKREIIRMNHPAIQPSEGRAPAVDGATLRRWLTQGHDDAGKPVVMLDTRNAFELEHGRFDGALDWGLSKFSEFPRALAAHRGELEGKTVVTYCTGGIRCEKAALVMTEAGLQDVWQLEGGILQYFEETGGAHFQGSCFVFDERVALDSQLAPAKTPAPAA